jgi:hypothetical protein
MTPFATSFTEILITISIGVLSFDKEPTGSAKDFEQFEKSIERVKQSLHLSERIANRVISS